MRILSSLIGCRETEERPALLRAMYPGDVDYCLEVERACFGAEAWDGKDFACVFDFDLEDRGLTYGMIAEAAGRLVGFGVAHRVGRSVTIMNLGVLPAFRRKGIGRILLESLCQPTMRCEPRTLHALVHETNMDAQRFFHALGWRATQVVRRPWKHLEEDGYRFRCSVRQCSGK